MDPHAELDRFKMELYREFESIQPIIEDKLGEYSAKCYEDAGEDAEKFVTCVKKREKSLNYHQSIFGFKVEHAVKKANACFLENPTAKRIEKCKSDTRSLIERYTKDFHTSV